MIFLNIAKEVAIIFAYVLLPLNSNKIASPKQNIYPSEQKIKNLTLFLEKKEYMQKKHPINPRIWLGKLISNPKILTIIPK